MKVQTRILLLLLGFFVVFVAALGWLKVAQARRFKRIANERAAERNAIFDQFLKERGDNLSVLVEDSSIWDDMVRAVLKSDIPWLEEHISDESLATYHANAAWVCKEDGSLLYSRNNRYADNLRELPVSADALVARLLSEHTCHFFCKVPQGWMEIRASSIHPSRDRFRETTSRGYFVAGQIWMDENIRRMAMFTGYKINIVP